ncbi:uncharacterized protein C12orf40 homolog isoform X2 [Fukomys damarensis]|uniref:uncharacterized protein C12orf40 homolog isoform X2 n=1 Tax=Fukomys damarensis TaxID=885580 RepID=UPI000F3339D5|nr:uncharacterized protein C12orf40 homolog isoform X2 [Fukomys damarensis]
MNWVGGSRTRVLIKQEKRKQKEYFERNRLKSKMKLLGVLSPTKNSTVSLDLLNLYTVNQISCKKKAPETVKKPIHVNMNRDIKMSLRQHELELAMSPQHVPSKLCLDGTENNNISYHKLSNKTGCGPVQSSQVTDTHSIFEPQFSRTENCSFTVPSFSTELSSDRYIPKQTFTPSLVPSPSKIAFEKKQIEQLSNVDCSDSLVSKLSECPDVLSSPHEVANFGTLFEQSNNPGNGDFLTTRTGVASGEDWRSMNERQSDFSIEEQAAQCIWGENGEEISTFLKDVNQPVHSILSENCDSLVGHNMVNLLNIDQQMTQKTFDKRGYNSLGNACLVTNSDGNHSTGGGIRSIFTVSESTLSNSAFNKTSCPEKCQPIKNYQKEHNSNEVCDLSTSFVDCYPASYENRGKRENDYQKKTPPKNIQEDPVSSMWNSPLRELHPNQSWGFGLDEILMEGGTRSLNGMPTSTKKICLDSSQGSQCTSYSPRPTESCFSSSSEMPSEDEDQILTQDHIEDSNEISTKTTETNNNFHLERMTELSDNSIVNSNAQFHKQSEKLSQCSVKNTTDQFLQSQCESAHALKSKASNCILQVVKCDTGVQTEREPVMKERSDAAVQCDVPWKCACGRDVAPLRSVEGCTENITAHTTGGQDILKNS